MNLLEQSTRVALAAFLHDIGKLAERAGIDHAGRLAAHKTLYCPWHQVGTDTRNGYHTHIHADYTRLAWDALEASGHFPDLRRALPAQRERQLAAISYDDLEQRCGGG